MMIFDGGFVGGSGVSIRVWNILSNSMERLLKEKILVLLSKQLDEYLIWIFGLFTCLGCVSRTIEIIFDR